MRDDQIEPYNQIRRAIRLGSLPAVKMLLSRNMDMLFLDTPFGTWLHMAAALGQTEIAQWLLSQGIDVNVRSVSIEGRPLDEAASNGDLEMVRCLLESGASLDVSESVRNPLFAAIVGGLSPSHNAVAQLLIDSGINTSIRYSNVNNMNALEYAREWGRADIVRMLEESRESKTTGS